MTPPATRKPPAKKAATKRAAPRQSAPSTLTPPALVIDATARQAMPVDLVGVRYLIQPPKAALALKMAVRAKQADNTDTDELVGGLYEWMDMAFGSEQSEAVKERLDDPEDLLDIQHITVLMQAVMEASANLPTT